MFAAILAIYLTYVSRLSAANIGFSLTMAGKYSHRGINANGCAERWFLASRFQRHYPLVGADVQWG